VIKGCHILLQHFSSVVRPHVIHYRKNSLNGLADVPSSRCRTILADCMPNRQGRIHSVSLGGAISVIFGSQVSLRVHYCKRDEVYFTTLLWQHNGRQNGLISRMLFSELFKIMVKKVTFVGFRGGDRPNRTSLDPPLLTGTFW